MVEYACSVCFSGPFRTHQEWIRHQRDTGHQNRQPATDDLTDTATIVNATLTLTCYCHREAIQFTTPRITVSTVFTGETNGLGVESFRVAIEMPSEGFHHPEPYAIMVRGETEDAIFAFPFLEIRKIRPGGPGAGWIGHFRSKPDKTGSHFAVKQKNSVES